LSDHPERVTLSVLGTFPEYVAFRAIRHEEHEGVGTSVVSTPSEAIGALVEDSNAALAADLLERVLAQPPVLLETLILKLLAAMGYGGRESLLEHTSQPGDAGLDGLVRRDALGLDLIGMQAKRYDPDTRFNTQRCRDSSEHFRVPKPTGACLLPLAALPRGQGSSPRASPCSLSSSMELSSHG